MIVRSAVLAACLALSTGAGAGPVVSPEACRIISETFAPRPDVVRSAEYRASVSAFIGEDRSCRGPREIVVADEAEAFGLELSMALAELRILSATMRALSEGRPGLDMPEGLDWLRAVDRHGRPWPTSVSPAGNG